MFEIEFDVDITDYKEQKMIPSNATVVFQYAKQFIVYYCYKRKYRYYVLNIKTLESAFIEAADESWQLSDMRDKVQKVTSSPVYRFDLPNNPKLLIRDIFCKILTHYNMAVRDIQIELSISMFRGMRYKKAAICEAEVGTGKTMAYLVAAIVYRLYKVKEIKSAARPVTITTSSIELQKSIIEKDIPLLSKALLQFGVISADLKAVLRKGKEHYICEARCLDYIAMLEKEPNRNGVLLHKLRDLSISPSVLDLDQYRGIRQGVKNKICVKYDCMDCSLDICRYRTFIEQAKKPYGCDFQVTNHNLFVMDMLCRFDSGKINGILVPADVCIIDEAHKLNEAVYQVFGTELESNSLPNLMKDLRFEFNKIKVKPKIYAHKLKNIQIMNDALFKQFLQNQKASTDEDIKRIRIKMTRPIKRQIIKLYIQLQEVMECCQPLLKPKEKHINKVINILKTFIESDDIICWLNVVDDNMSFCGIPKNITDLMYKVIWNESSNKVLTSGTMSDDQGFYYFKSETGIDRLSPCQVYEGSTASPFDYRRNTRLYISDAVPFPNPLDTEYVQALAGEITRLVRATHGHTAILFTSYRLLFKVYERVKDKLCEYPLIQMTRSNKNAISDFKKSGNGVLFASGSMWEGVDCVGDILSSIIIVKLPFPIRDELMEEKKESCDNLSMFINRYVIPQMMIKLKQGMGRLIRSETDTGVISILDYRAGKNGAYRSRVLKAAEKYPLVHSLDEVEQFINEMKDDTYFMI